jgi:hypothetical protein
MAKVTEDVKYTIELSKDEVESLYGLVAYGASAPTIKQLGLMDLYTILREVLGDSNKFEDFYQVAILY